MSENFEKIILEKLNKIDGRLDKVDSRLDKVDSRLDKLEVELVNTKEIVNENTKTLNNVVVELKDTQEVVILNRNTLLKMEQRNHDNFGVLFDSFSANDDKHKEFSKSIKNLQNDSFEHNIRLSILEDILKPIKEA